MTDRQARTRQTHACDSAARDRVHNRNSHTRRRRRAGTQRPTNTRTATATPTRGSYGRTLATRDRIGGSRTRIGPRSRAFQWRAIPARWMGGSHQASNAPRLTFARVARCKCDPSIPSMPRGITGRARCWIVGWVGVGWVLRAERDVGDGRGERQACDEKEHRTSILRRGTARSRQTRLHTRCQTGLQAKSAESLTVPHARFCTATSVS